MSGTERRSGRRFETHVPLIVRWASASRVSEAVTEPKDINSRGIHFLLPQDIKNGSPTEIVMALAHEITLIGPVKVLCQGRIH